MWAKIHTCAASLKLKWKVLSLRPLLKDINDIHFQSHFYPFTINYRKERHFRLLIEVRIMYVFHSLTFPLLYGLLNSLNDVVGQI